MITYLKLNLDLYSEIYYRDQICINTNSKFYILQIELNHNNIVVILKFFPSFLLLNHCTHSKIRQKDAFRRRKTIFYNWINFLAERRRKGKISFIINFLLWQVFFSLFLTQRNSEFNINLKYICVYKIYLWLSLGEGDEKIITTRKKSFQKASKPTEPY